MNRMLIFGMGVAIIGSAASGAAAAATAAAATAAASAAQEPARASTPGQKPVIHRALHRHRVARRARPAAPDPRTAFAKGRSAEVADTRTVLPDKQEDILQPRSVPTISVPAPPAIDEPLKESTVLAVDDPARTASIWSVASRASSPSRGMEVMIVLGTCAGAAMGVYGLLAFKSRRRNSPAARQSQSVRAGLLSSAADRTARQKLFPHQLAMSFESRLSAAE
jgi:hypothetical protein